MFDLLSIGLFLDLLFGLVAAGLLGFIYSEFLESGRFDRVIK